MAECTSSTATAARSTASASRGSGPAATNTSSGRSRLPPAAIVAPGVLGQHRAVGARELGQARLEALHQLRDVRAAGLDHRGDRLGAGHQAALVPECRAMIPPAVRIQRTSASPAAAITPPSSLGPGKRFTELGRYV